VLDANAGMRAQAGCFHFGAHHRLLADQDYFGIGITG
jgi:hypothetical protein